MLFLETHRTRTEHTWNTWDLSDIATVGEESDLKVVILAGGFGTRISEESHSKPKPMIEIGGKPILHHIMKIYSHFGFHEFIVCLGYKGHVIKDYFASYLLHASDVIFDFKNGDDKIMDRGAVEPWQVTLADTGSNSMTGGRLKRIQKYVGHEPFMLTYGDGVADIRVDQLLDYHRQHGKLATLTAYQPDDRFGALEVNPDGQITRFAEKAKGGAGWINAGYFVMQPEVFDYIDADDTVLESDVLSRLAKEGQLMAYPHKGFWHPMDTLRDKNHLEQLWNAGAAPWMHLVEGGEHQ